MHSQINSSTPQVTPQHNGDIDPGRSERGLETQRHTERGYRSRERVQTQEDLREVFRHRYRHRQREGTDPGRSERSL